jgi:hypothetical protein
MMGVFEETFIYLAFEREFRSKKERMVVRNHGEKERGERDLISLFERRRVRREGETLNRAI